MTACPETLPLFVEPDWADAKVQEAERETASQYWKTIVDELASQQTMAAANRHAIIRLVLAMLTYEDAQEQVNRDGAVIEAPKTRVKMQHPALSIANKQGQIIAKLEADLGITVMKRAAAAKSKVATKRKPDGGTGGGVTL